MPIYKLCSRCKKVIDKGNTYCEECDKVVKSYRNKRYNKLFRNQDSQRFYNSNHWKRVSKDIKSRDKGMCIVCLNNNKIKHKDIIHHIVPLEDSKELSLKHRNLISVCLSCHNTIHNIYNTDDNSKKILQDRLNDMVNNNVLKG